MNTLIVIITLAIAGILIFSKKLRASSAWRATLTPLASIMGSGFLVCAPLIGGIAGPWSLAFMLILLAVAYTVGETIRYNIRHFEPIEHHHGTTQKIALASRAVLAIAYFISVAYYLQLLAAFVLHTAGTDNTILAKSITTAILLTIAAVGILRGLSCLESLEKYAVSLNLGMIAALLAALAIHNIHLANTHTWQLPPLPENLAFTDFRILLGLLIVVQGFETSRYLGAEHPAEQRITTMRRAQWISSAIYLTFIALMTVFFKPNLSAEVTEVITLTAPIAAILPILITLAAVGSQFSAAVADNSAAGGLLQDILSINPRLAYAIILTVAIAITWLTSVTEIISIASRAFALFYALQATVATLTAHKNHHPKRTLAYATITTLCLLITILGIPAE